MSEDSIEVKPCKYCGKMPYIYDDYSSEQDKTFWRIYCLSDNCPGDVINSPWEDSTTSTGWYESKGEAIKAWNTIVSE